MNKKQLLDYYLDFFNEIKYDDNEFERAIDIILREAIKNPQILKKLELLDEELQGTIYDD